MVVSDGDSDKLECNCGSCVQRGAKHPGTVGHTDAANSVDDADHVEAL